MEKLYKIYYGDEENDYIKRYLKDEEIINGYLSEAKAFEIFYNNMIRSNNYLQNNYDNLEILINGYNEEDDYYIDEYQVFIIDSEYDEDITKKATEKMGNTFYYDLKNEIYLTGITDLGTSRTIVSTDIKVIEERIENIIAKNDKKSYFLSDENSTAVCIVGENGVAFLLGCRG